MSDDTARAPAIPIVAWAALRPDGTLARTGSCPMDQLAAQGWDGLPIVLCPPEVDRPDRWRHDGEGFVAVPEAPPTIDELRMTRWTEAKLVRTQVEFGGAETPFGRVDTDQASQLRVAGAVQMAMLARDQGAPFSIDWTMADNSTVTLDAGGMMTVGLAIAAHVNACHEAARSVREAVAAAADAEALATIPIAAGYPA